MSTSTAIDVLRVLLSAPAAGIVIITDRTEIVSDRVLAVARAERSLREFSDAVAELRIAVDKIKTRPRRRADPKPEPLRDTTSSSLARMSLRVHPRTVHRARSGLPARFRFYQGAF